MHMQVVNFRLSGIDGDQYAAMCDAFAPAFANVPGLVQKVWLANPETGVYGGVYTWQDRAAMERFMSSDLFKKVATHPHLAEITATDFGVLDAPTRVTSSQAIAAL